MRSRKRHRGCHRRETVEWLGKEFVNRDAFWRYQRLLKSRVGSVFTRGFGVCFRSLSIVRTSSQAFRTKYLTWRKH